MLTRQQFLWIYDSLKMECEINGMCQTPMNPAKADFIWHFVHPYVLVVHESTKRGYYLNRSYQLIVEVQDPPIPGKPEMTVSGKLTRVQEVTNNHVPASQTYPEWVNGVRFSEFTTYWLY